MNQRLSATLTTSDIVSAINAQSDNTGVTAGIVGTTLTLTDIDGDTIDVDQTLGGDLGAGTGLDATAFNTAGVISGSITLSASENIAITGGTNIGFGTQVAVDTTTLAAATIATVEGANDVINRVDAALTTVSNLRSEFGALQSRFESTITNLETVSESLTASRGRIRDADFAAETASLTKAQILQQAGVAILSQANAQPQLALSLLQ